jgi:hypothetical protein
MNPFLEQPPDASLSFTNFLGGAIHDIIAEGSGTETPVDYDRDGCSAAFRLTWYTTAMLTIPEVVHSTTDDQMTSTLQHIAIFAEVANDQISVPPHRPVCNSDAKMADFSAKAHCLISRLIEDTATGTTLVSIAQGRLLAAAAGHSTLAYYNARAYVSITTELMERRGQTTYIDGQHTASLIGKSPYLFVAAALLSGSLSSKTRLRLYNECLAELTAWSPKRDLLNGKSKSCR